MEYWPYHDPSDPDFRLGQEIGIYIVLLIGAISGMIASVLRYAIVFAE